MRGCVTVTRGISGSSICAPDNMVVFQYPGDTGLELGPSAVDERIDVRKIFWTAGANTGRHATMVPARGTMQERRDLRAELWVGSSRSRLDPILMRTAEMAMILCNLAS